MVEDGRCLVYNQGRRLGVLEGANAPPKNFCAPPKESLGGAKKCSILLFSKNKLSFP